MKGENLITLFLLFTGFVCIFFGILFNHIELGASGVATIFMSIGWYLFVITINEDTP